MIESTNEITQEGLEKLIAELDELKNVRISEIAKRIKEAKDFGDLSENSEYTAAKEEQAMVATKIEKLEGIIENAVVIDTSNINVKSVGVGVKVKLFDYDFDEEVEYKIVGDPESNPLDGLLSAASPVGSALIGKKKGDIVEANVPDGVAKYKILKISK